MAKHGDIDLTNAYRIATGLGSPKTFHGKWVWDLKILPRVQTFLWKCYHYNIGVRECLASRGMSIDVTCPLCQANVESISHGLRDCPIINLSRFRWEFPQLVASSSLKTLTNGYQQTVWLLRQGLSAIFPRI